MSPEELAQQSSRFNEAAGSYPRKLAGEWVGLAERFLRGFNEAAGSYPRKHVQVAGTNQASLERLQ